MEPSSNLNTGTVPKRPRLDENGPIEMRVELLKDRCMGISSVDEEVLNRLLTNVENIQLDISDRDDVTLTGFQFDMDTVYSLIDYIIKDARLLFCYEAWPWQQYVEDNPPQSDECFSCENLRDFFIGNVLPKIYTYNLSESTKKALRVLDINSSFERVGNGYLAKPKLKYDTANMSLRRDVDFTLIKASEFPDAINGRDDETEQPATASRFLLDTKKDNPAEPQIVAVLGDGSALPQEALEVPQDVHALCSAVVAKDYELFSGVCLEPDEMLKRLRNARKEFMETGRLPDNFFPDKLREKVEKMKKLRESVINVTNKRFK